MEVIIGRLCSDSSERLSECSLKDLWLLIACRVYRPPPAIRRRAQTRSSKDSARTSNTSTTTTRRLGTMYKHLLSTSRIRSAARSTCVICYFTRHVQQLYCYKLLTFTFVAAGSMAASRTACELRLSCTLAHPSRFLVVLVLGPGLLASPLRPRVSTWIMSSWLSLKSMMC